MAGSVGWLIPVYIKVTITQDMQVSTRLVAYWGTDGDHGGICHESGQPICKARPKSLEASFCYQWLALCVDQVRARQLCGVAVQRGRDNMISKETEIPVIPVYKFVK